ncbi:hypothetical protein IC744_10055 [Microbacterium hominis]|nr:hypothetical protein IC744_10055 [Microbacterium hominis]
MLHLREQRDEVDAVGEVELQQLQAVPDGRDAHGLALEVARRIHGAGGGRVAQGDDRELAQPRVALAHVGVGGVVPRRALADQCGVQRQVALEALVARRDGGEHQRARRGDGVAVEQRLLGGAVEGGDHRRQEQILRGEVLEQAGVRDSGGGGDVAQ